MRSRSPLAGSPEASDRREPSLGRNDAQPAPRLVAQERPGSPRATLRGAAAPSLELRAGERAVVASAIAAPVPGELSLLLKKLGLAVLALLALIGVATLIRPFVGL
jgi:hypothetical protein